VVKYEVFIRRINTSTRRYDTKLVFKLLIDYTKYHLAIVFLDIR